MAAMKISNDKIDELVLVCIDALGRASGLLAGLRDFEVQSIALEACFRNADFGSRSGRSALDAVRRSLVRLKERDEVINVGTKSRPSWRRKTEADRITSDGSLGDMLSWPK